MRYTAPPATTIAAKDIDAMPVIVMYHGVMRQVIVSPVAVALPLVSTSDIAVLFSLKDLEGRLVAFW